MHEHKLSTQMLAKQCGISSISLQLFLFGRLPNMTQLDHLTTTMGLQIGDLYVLYEAQLRHEKRAWSRTFHYLIHCAKHTLHDHLISGVKHCFAMKHGTVHLFHLAEHLHSIQLFSAAEIIYNLLIKASTDEEDAHLVVSKEIVAMCQFRIFQQICGKQFGHAPSALRFIPFRNSLPTEYALEGLLLLSQNFIAQERYESAEQYADELSDLAYEIYQKRCKKWFKSKIKTSRPLLLYYGQAFLLKGISYEKRGLYDESKYWVMRYADLSWFEGTEEEKALATQRFAVLAKGNMMCLNVKSGDQEVIPDYVQFLKENPEQIIEGLINLVSAANKYKYSVDDVLDDFIKEMNTFNFEIINHSSQRELFQCQRYVQFHYHYAEYCFERKRVEIGIQHTLTSLHYAKGMKNNSIFVRSMSLFEKNRSYATIQQQNCYEELCQDILSRTNEEQPESFDFFWQMMTAGV